MRHSTSQKRGRRRVIRFDNAIENSKGGNRFIASARLIRIFLEILATAILTAVTATAILAAIIVTSAGHLKWYAVSE
jgi:hypothetical protein